MPSIDFFFLFLETEENPKESIFRRPDNTSHEPNQKCSSTREICLGKIYCLGHQICRTLPQLQTTKPLKEETEHGIWQTLIFLLVRDQETYNSYRLLVSTQSRHHIYGKLVDQSLLFEISKRKLPSSLCPVFHPLLGRYLRLVLSKHNKAVYLFQCLLSENSGIRNNKDIMMGKKNI